MVESVLYYETDELDHSFSIYDTRTNKVCEMIKRQFFTVDIGSLIVRKGKENKTIVTTGVYKPNYSSL